MGSRTPLKFWALLTSRTSTSQNTLTKVNALRGSLKQLKMLKKLTISNICIHNHQFNHQLFSRWSNSRWFHSVRNENCTSFMMTFRKRINRNRRKIRKSNNLKTKSKYWSTKLAKESKTMILKSLRYSNYIHFSHNLNCSSQAWVKKSKYFKTIMTLNQINYIRK